MKNKEPDNIHKDIELSLFCSDSTSQQKTLEASLRSSSLLELSSTINVDSNFIKDLKSIYKKTRFSIDIDTCILFRFVNGLWWEAMTIIDNHKFIDQCDWSKVPKDKITGVESLFEIGGYVPNDDIELNDTSHDITRLLSKSNVHFERFKIEHGGVAFTPTGNDDYSQYDSAFLVYIAAIISFCVDKNLSSQYLEGVYDSLQTIAYKHADDNEVPAIYLDPSTGLYSKLGFLKFVERLFDAKEQKFSIVILSLEKYGGAFNLLDDETQQSLLTKTIQRIKTLLPDNRSLSKLNGNELAFVMLDTTTEKVDYTLHQIMNKFLNNLQVGEHTIHCGLLAGYSSYDNSVVNHN